MQSDTTVELCLCTITPNDMWVGPQDIHQLLSHVAATAKEVWPLLSNASYVSAFVSVFYTLCLLICRGMPWMSQYLIVWYDSRCTIGTVSVFYNLRQNVARAYIQHGTYFTTRTVPGQRISSTSRQNGRMKWESWTCIWIVWFSNVYHKQKIL